MSELDKLAPEEIPSSSDPQAQKEADFFDRTPHRKEAERKHLHLVFLVLLWIGVVAFSASLFILILHYTAPECWRWLSANDIDHLKSILGSALVGGVISKLIEYKLRANSPAP